MNLDQQLGQPLAPVRDDGFSFSVAQRVRIENRRLKTIMWGLLAIGFLPVLAVLPYVEISTAFPSGLADWLDSQISYPLGALLLLWVWKPRLFPR